MNKRYHLVVCGNVQRVGYRNHAAQLATELNLGGKAAYIDQNIEIEVEGSNLGLDTFISWCKVGPEGCVVTELDMTEIVPTGEKTFEIVHGISFSDNIAV
jgi:acylphosphatase